MRALALTEVDAFLTQKRLRRVGVYTNSRLPLDCVCLDCGLAVSPTYKNLKKGQGGCKFCAGGQRGNTHKIPEAEAELEMRTAGVEPLEPYVNSKHPWRSRCLTCGEIVTPQYANVKNGHAACKFCSKRAITPEKAAAIYLASGARPVTPYVRSNLPWAGKCLSCAGDVNPRLGDLIQGQGPCRKCGIERLANENRLTEEEATNRMLEAGAEPLEPWGNKNVDSGWLCACLICGSIIAPSIHSVTSGQGPCVHCGRLKTAEKNTLDGAEQVAVLEEFGFRALEPYQGMGKPWNTECLKCGVQEKRRLSNIKSGFGCRSCAYEAAKIPQDVAVVEMNKRGWEPLESYVAANLPWKCKCRKCGNIQSPRLYSLSHSRPSGCLNCGERTLGSTFYLVRHDGHKAYKVGVGKDRRIDDHRWQGWILVKRWEMETPQDAYRLEREFLLYIREQLQLPQYLDNQDMPQNGATETFSSDSSADEDWIRLVHRLL